MMKTLFLVLLVLATLQPAFAQLASNRLHKSSGTDSLNLGLDFFAAIQQGAVSHYDNYEDPLHYLVSPYLHYKFNPQLTIDFRLNLENIRDDYVYPRRTYWGDEFAKHRGGIEIGKIEYKNDWLDLRFGRDYFIPGKRFYEGLLFSGYNYSYDQIWMAIHKGRLEIASYYLDLTDWGTAKRYLNGHRFSWKFGQGYVAFNDVALYGGENRQFKPALMNPFILFYPYQKNRRNFESNSLMSFELYFPWRDYFLFAEFLIDDFQVDKEVPGDLEPNEWGINITIGKNKLFNKLDWKANYTRVANRTFNAPIKDYEKYIYKNDPIGHFLGNNFWELKSSLTFRPMSGWRTTLNGYYLESGSEALYGAFNKDYLNYTVQQGYQENFPFGDISHQAGIHGIVEFNAVKNIWLSSEAAFWFFNDRLARDFCLRFSLEYHLGIYTR